MSSLINKAKDKLEQTIERSSNKGDNPHSSNAGPHSSNVMNKVDPTIDSDRDHRNDPTSRVGGLGNTQEYNTIHSQHTAPGVAGGVGGVEPGYGQPVGHTGGLTGHTAGHPVGHTGPTGGFSEPGVGHAGHTGGLSGPGVSHAGHTGDFTSHSIGHAVHAGGVGGPTAGGYAGATNTYDNPQSTNTGPHRSNLANKLDPRFDSDNDNRNDPTSRVGGYGTQDDTYGHNAGMPGTHGGVGHTTHGPGATAGVGGHGHSSMTPGSGNAQNTAGPHNSDLLNKMDPRVDADLDGSKTYGGNATYR